MIRQTWRQSKSCYCFLYEFAFHERAREAVSTHRFHECILVFSSIFPLFAGGCPCYLIYFIEFIRLLPAAEPRDCCLISRISEFSGSPGPSPDDKAVYYYVDNVSDVGVHRSGAASQDTLTNLFFAMEGEDAAPEAVLQCAMVCEPNALCLYVRVYGTYSGLW